MKTIFLLLLILITCNLFGQTTKETKVNSDSLVSIELMKYSELGQRGATMEVLGVILAGAGVLLPQFQIAIYLGGAMTTAGWILRASAYKRIYKAGWIMRYKKPY